MKKKKIILWNRGKTHVFKTFTFKSPQNVLSVSPGAALAVKVWLAGTAEPCFLSLGSQPVCSPASEGDALVHRLCRLYSVGLKYRQS